MTRTIEFYYHKAMDLKGRLIFEKDGFWLCTPGKKQFVLFDDVGGISRLTYDRQASAIVVSYSYKNPNKYRIELKNGQNFEFCVSHKEENAYQASIDRLRKKIYGFNKLGFGLTSKVQSVTAAARRVQDTQFEREMPPREFTLEKAIAALLQHCAIELNDLTEDDVL